MFKWRTLPGMQLDPEVKPHDSWHPALSTALSWPLSVSLSTLAVPLWLTACLSLALALSLFLNRSPLSLPQSPSFLSLANPGSQCARSMSLSPDTLLLSLARLSASDSLSQSSGYLTRTLAHSPSLPQQLLPCPHFRCSHTPATTRTLRHIFSNPRITQKGKQAAPDLRGPTEPGFHLHWYTAASQKAPAPCKLPRMQLDPDCEYNSMPP